MIATTLNGVRVGFIDDSQSPTVEEFVHDSTAAESVLFVVLNPARWTSDILALRDRGYRVVVCSSFDETTNTDELIARNLVSLRENLETAARIQIGTTAHRLEVGEFAGAGCIVADNDVGIFLAVLKAIGLVYPSEHGGVEALDSDAQIFERDGNQALLSLLGRSLHDGLALLSLLDPANPSDVEEPIVGLYRPFARAIHGGPKSSSAYAGRISTNSDSMRRSTVQLIDSAVEVAEGIFQIDTAGASPYNRDRLYETLREKGGKLLFVRTTYGSIAQRHGHQFDLHPLVDAYADLARLEVGAVREFGWNMEEIRLDGNKVSVISMSPPVFTQFILPHLLRRFGSPRRTSGSGFQAVWAAIEHIRRRGSARLRGWTRKPPH